MMRSRDTQTPRPRTTSSSAVYDRPSTTCLAGAGACRHEAGRDNNYPWKLLLSDFPAVPSHQQSHDRLPASAVDATSENASSVTAYAPHDHFPTALYFRRHASVSSRHTQRTQSTLEAVPTGILSTVARRHHNTCRKPSIASSIGSSTRCITPLQFFKQTLGHVRGSVVATTGTDAYQWYASQASESSCGFQYATTPSVGNSENEVPVAHPITCGTPTIRPKLTPTALERPKCKTQLHLVMGSMRFFEELANKLKDIVNTGNKLGGISRKVSVNGRIRNGKTDTAAAPSPNKRRRTKKTAHAGRDSHDTKNFAWDYGEKILRVKNNGTGSCVFVVTSDPDNPHGASEVPLPYAFLRSHLFAHSEPLCRSLEEWNRHFQKPPIHWVVNFVPKAYLRKGWHLAEEVAGYLRLFGLNAGEGASRAQGGSRWRVEYEAIGHKPCLVDENSRLPGALIPPSYGPIRAARNASHPQRQRYPSMFWERKDEGDAGGGGGGARGAARGRRVGAGTGVAVTAGGGGGGGSAAGGALAVGIAL